MNVNVWEWLMLIENRSSSMGEGHSMVVDPIWHAWCRIGDASDDLSMDDHVCDENVWKWLTMCENDPHPGSGCWSFYADIHHTTSMMLNGNAADHPIIDENVCDEKAGECMRMNENVWEWPLFREVVCESFYADLHKTTSMMRSGDASDYLMTDEHVCDETAWEWLRSEWLTFREWVWVIRCWYTLYDMHDNELRLHQTIS